MSAGFYKNAGDGLEVLYAPNSVNSPTTTLRATARVGHVYPIEGWTWFNSEDAARTAFSLPSVATAEAARSLLVVYPEVPKATAIKSSNALITDMPTFKPRKI